MPYQYIITAMYYELYLNKLGKTADRGKQEKHVVRVKMRKTRSMSMKLN